MSKTVTAHTNDKTEYRKDRILYIVQAMVEYFITIAVGSTYLTKVAIDIGMNDSTIALLTSVIHFSCAFQLLSIPLNKIRRPKRWLTASLLLIEVCFTLIYVIPIVSFPQGSRPILLMVAVILGNSLQNINSSPKASWMIGFVPNDRRGKFTAYLQIVSLIGSIIFSYVLGYVIDSFEARGDLHGAFTVSGIVIAVLSVTHVILFLSTKEIPNEAACGLSVSHQVRSILRNKNLRKILPVYLLYSIATMCATPFYNTYQIKELGFSMALIALLTALSSAVRAVVAVFCGKYGDKYGFMRLLNISYILLAIGFFINIFTVPENGKLLFTLYMVITGLSTAGTAIADSNLIFEYASLETRVGVLAIKGTACGILSFAVTLAMSFLVSHIQENGNTFLGINAYAQQVASAIAFLATVVLLIYVNTVAKTAKRDA